MSKVEKALTGLASRIGSSRKSTKDLASLDRSK